jgi:hypothetical protein
MMRRFDHLRLGGSDLRVSGRTREGACAEVEAFTCHVKAIGDLFVALSAQLLEPGKLVVLHVKELCAGRQVTELLNAIGPSRYGIFAWRLIFDRVYSIQALVFSDTAHCLGAALVLERGFIFGRVGAPSDVLCAVGERGVCLGGRFPGLADLVGTAYGRSVGMRPIVLAGLGHVKGVVVRRGVCVGLRLLGDLGPVFGLPSRRSSLGDVGGRPCLFSRLVNGDIAGRVDRFARSAPCLWCRDGNLRLSRRTVRGIGVVLAE